MPLSLPAQKRECGFSARDDEKYSIIRTTEETLASPQLVFAALTFGSDVNLHELWTVQVFASLGA